MGKPLLSFMQKSGESTTPMCINKENISYNCWCEKEPEFEIYAKHCNKYKC